jgi:hypothetical protein
MSISIDEADVRLLATLWVLLAVVSAFVAVITAVDPRWIESLFGLDLDRGNGAAEWMLVIAAGATPVLARLHLARRLAVAR